MVGEGALTQEVVTAVASAEGVDPSAVEPPLSESIDTEAMERLFRETRGELTFEYKDYRVTVSSDGEIALQPMIT